MLNADDQDIHRTALQRWPGLLWPLASYRAHRGTNQPRFPLDHCLGGAAGYQAAGAWDAIYQDIRPEVLNALRTRATADYKTDLEELWSVTLEKKFLPACDRSPTIDGESPPCKLARYRGDVKLSNHLLNVALRVAIDRHRALQSRPNETPASVLTPADQDRRIAPDVSAATPEPGPVDQVLAQETEKAAVGRLREALAQLRPELQLLAQMVWVQNMPKQDAGDQLGWPNYKVSKELKKIKDIIHHAVNGS